MTALTLADLMDPESGRPALLACGLVVGAGALYAAYVARRNPAWHQSDGASETVGIAGKAGPSLANVVSDSWLTKKTR
jgi:hypothetical protein